MLSTLELRFGDSRFGNFLWHTDGHCPYIAYPGPDWTWRDIHGSELVPFTALCFPG